MLFRSGHYEKWFRNLMSREEYAAHKKRYYSSIIKADFDKVKDLPVYLYGAGELAKYLLNILSDLHLANEITAVIVSDKAGNPAELNGIAVRQLDEIDAGECFGILFGVNESNRRQIEAALEGYHYYPVELNMQVITRYDNIVNAWRYSGAL